MYPGNPLTLSIKEILDHYRNTGFRPSSKQSMNAVIREQYLALKETHAFCVDLVERGVIEDDDSARTRLENACDELEGYIRYLDSSGHLEAERSSVRGNKRQ
jgi:hypothetical protein